MAYTFVTGKGNGSDTSFPFAFTGLGRGYLRASDVHVETRESGTTEWVEGVSFTLSGTNTIELDSPLITPEDDLDNLRIRRIMPKDEPYANWNVGQNYSDFVINNSFLQQLYTMHEVLDGFIPEMNTDLNMNGFRIVGLQYDLNDPESVATVGALIDAIEQINRVISEASDGFDATLNAAQDMNADAIEQINRVISEASDGFDATLNAAQDMNADAIERVNKSISDANDDFDATLNAVESIQTAFETLQTNVNTIYGSIQTSQAEVNEDRQFVEEQAGRFEFATQTQVEHADGDALVQAKNIGSRAATFGLDGRNMQLPIGTSLERDFPTGNYDCEEFLDSPISGWCHLFVHRHSNPNNYQYQELVSLTTQPVIKYHRVLSYSNYQGSAWQRIYDSHTLPTVTQQEAIDPENTNVYAWTPQRVAQVASNQSGGLGINQRWQLAELSDTGATFDDGTAAYRAVNVEYTNTLDYPISVAMTSQYVDGNPEVHLYVDGVEVPSTYGNWDNHGRTGATAIIPPGSSYRFTSTHSLGAWAELR